MKFERWAWTELIAFDNTQADGGATEYLATLNFAPEVLCLLISSPDFALQHQGMDCEYILPPEVCSRHAHPGNEVRNRQEWTNVQLRSLIGHLTRAGVAVYFSQFTNYFLDEFHHEWLSDHQEARQAWSFDHRGLNLNPLAQLDDGTLFEDIYIPKLVKICRDYGFSGWHGPDGWGPLSSGNIMGTDFSDSMMKQFLAGRDWTLPECLARPCPAIVTQEERTAARKAGLPEPKTGLAQLQERGSWVWTHRRKEWIAFHVDRWCQFWRKMTDALHRAGLKNAINSAWTKGTFDALYDYGIDYRKMAKLGIDAMVVEAVALGMTQTRPEEKWYHDDYAASLAEIKAAAPEFKLVFLHGIKDVVELWDNLRQATPGYERELYKLANLYYRDRGGLRRSADGLLACLADGIAEHEWKFIRERWQASFDGNPMEAGEVTVLWDDAQIDCGVDDFIRDGFLPGQKQFAALLRNGVQLQTVCRIENAECCPGAIYLPSAHLTAPKVLDQLLRSHPGPVIFSGRAEALERFFAAGEVVTDRRMAVVIAKGGNGGQITELPTPETPYRETLGDLYFSHDRARLAVAPELWPLAAAGIAAAARADLARRGLAYAEVSGGGCTLITRRISDRILDVALENRTEWGRITRTVRISQPIEKLEILSSFPLREAARPDARSFTLPVAPRGLSAVRVHCRQPQS